MLISTLNCEMWPNFSYRRVRPFQLSLLLFLLMVFSSENFGFSPPYAGIAGIGPVRKFASSTALHAGLLQNKENGSAERCIRAHAYKTVPFALFVSVLRLLTYF